MILVQHGKKARLRRTFEDLNLTEDDWDDLVRELEVISDFTVQQATQNRQITGFYNHGGIKLQEIKFGRPGTQYRIVCRTGHDKGAEATFIAGIYSRESLNKDNTKRGVAQKEFKRIKKYL